MIISVFLLGVAAVWLVGWKPRVNPRELGDYGTARFLDGHIQETWHPSAKLHKEEPPVLELNFHTISQADADFYERDPAAASYALNTFVDTEKADDVAGMGSSKDKVEHMQAWIDDKDNFNEWSAYQWASQYNKEHEEKIVIKYDEKAN